MYTARLVAHNLVGTWQGMLYSNIKRKCVVIICFPDIFLSSMIKAHKTCSYNKYQDNNIYPIDRSSSNSTKIILAIKPVDSYAICFVTVCNGYLYVYRVGKSVYCNQVRVTCVRAYAQVYVRTYRPCSCNRHV